jgi:thioredoxin reductase (NADPH)
LARLDVAIVGAGPAGLTTGIYTSRSGLSTRIYEKGLPGGLMTVTDHIDNYPGFPRGISGMNLGKLMQRQAGRFGAEIESVNIESLAGRDGHVLLKTGSGEIASRAAVVASGSTPRSLGVPGEAELTGKGVSYGAVCDGPLYKGLDVAMIGGGDSALQEALYLTRFAKSVTVIHRREGLRAARVLQAETRSNPKIAFALNKQVLSIEGGSEVKGVKVRDKGDGREEEIPAEGVFIYVGYSPSGDFLGPEFERGRDGFLITDSTLQTSVRGVFAAGDIRAKGFKQVSTAVGDGALAAMSVYAYLQGHR